MFWGTQKKKQRMGEEKRVNEWRGWHLLESLIYDYYSRVKEARQDALMSRGIKHATMIVHHLIPDMFKLMIH